MDRNKIADLCFWVQRGARAAEHSTALAAGSLCPRGSLRGQTPMNHSHSHTQTHPHTQHRELLKIFSNISAWNHTVASTQKMADKNNLAVGLHSISTFLFEYPDCWPSRKGRFFVLILLGCGEFYPRAQQSCSLHLSPDLYWTFGLKRSLGSSLGRINGFVIHVPSLCAASSNMGQKHYKNTLCPTGNKNTKYCKSLSPHIHGYIAHTGCLQQIKF